MSETHLTVSRRYHFEAAHFLPYVADTHKCKRMHGHNYEIEVTVSGSLVHGFIIDFWDLDKVVDPLVAQLDHRTLNDIHDLMNPTAENIAQWFFIEIERLLYQTRYKLEQIRVFETKECWADLKRRETK